MSISSLSSAQLKRLIQLVKTKEKFQSRMDRISAEIEGLDSGTVAATPKRRGRKPGRPPGSKSKKVKVEATKGKRGKRLKEPLLKALTSAGAGGMSVKDLAVKLKVKPGNIFSWFYTTGKKIKGITKVGEAKYAYAA